MKRNLWNSWSEYLNVRETDAFEESPENFAVQRKSDVMKLPYKDKDLFGYCSEYEEFYLVICKICGKRIKPQSLGFHMELRHNEDTKDDIFSHSDPIQETLPNVLPSSSKEDSDKEITLLNTNSENWSSSVIKEETVISNANHGVYVQPFPKPSSIESCQENSYDKISPYSSPSGIVRTTLSAKRFKSGNSESVSNTYIRELPPPESSLSACDSQTSMTIFLNHSFIMPNMKLCDIQDQCADNLTCLNSETWPQSSCLSEAPLLTQIIPENIGSPNQSSQIHHLNNEVADWNTEQNSSNLNLNGMTYSEWNQHSTHFRPLPPDVQMSQAEQMTSRSFNCPDIKRFDDLESQVLKNIATMGT